MARRVAEAEVVTLALAAEVVAAEVATACDLLAVVVRELTYEGLYGQSENGSTNLSHFPRRVHMSGTEASVIMSL